MDFQVNILGVPVSRLNREQLLTALADYLRSSRPHHLATVNPEFLLEAQRNQSFFHVLQHTDLNIPDGIGLKFAAWLHGCNLTRYAGSDLMQELLAMAEVQGLKVAIVNWSGGLSNNDEIHQVVQKSYPKLQCRVWDTERAGFVVEESLIAFAPELLFCALGSPWQEEFVSRAIKILPGLRLGLGIGGSFDFLTGKTQRAPHWLRAVGLEWVWRLFRKPQAGSKQVYRRYRRIYNAFVVFSWKAFWDRLGWHKRNF